MHPYLKSPEAKVQSSESVLVTIPVYEDWAAVDQLLVQLSECLDGQSMCADVLLVDDGSVQQATRYFDRNQLKGVGSIRVLRLNRNLGHQRALAVALSYIHAELNYGTVVIMDGDGEDPPSEIPRLLERIRETDNRQVIFAARALRSEGFTFTVFYHLYRFLHRCLTGIPIRFGNFSALPFEVLGRLVTVPELWNHYAAAVCKARVPYQTVSINRTKRLDGRSHMTFVSLVIHGMSAFSVHGEVLAVRLLFLSLGGGLFTVLTFAFVFGQAYIDQQPISGTMLLASMMAFSVWIHMFALSVIFCFIVLQSRSSAAFIPARDFRYFISEVVELMSHSPARVSHVG